MRCCVPFCETTAEIVSESADITFHGFPREVHLRAAWLRALGKQDALLPAGAVVCSLHFLDNEIYETESGSKQIRTGAVPAGVLICLICLNTCKELLLMSEFNLEEAYLNLVGHPPCGGGGLKQTLCVKCAQRLVDFSTLRDKSLRARSVVKKFDLPDSWDEDSVVVNLAGHHREDADTVACAYNERDCSKALEDTPAAAEDEAETQAPMKTEHTCEPESSEDRYQASVTPVVLATNPGNEE